MVLDHFLSGELSGLAAAPLIQAVASGVKIVLFSDFDLGSAADREPSIDAFLSKRHRRELLATVQRLLGLETLPDA